MEHQAGFHTVVFLCRNQQQFLEDLFLSALLSTYTCFFVLLLLWRWQRTGGPRESETAKVLSMMHDGNISRDGLLCFLPVFQNVLHTAHTLLLHLEILNLTTYCFRGRMRVERKLWLSYNRHFVLMTSPAAVSSFLSSSRPPAETSNCSIIFYGIALISRFLVHVR